jgi:hypothetical protein
METAGRTAAPAKDGPQKKRPGGGWWPMEPFEGVAQWKLTRLLSHREPRVPPDPPDGPERATRETLTGGFAPDGRSGALEIRLRPPETDDLLSPHVEATAVAMFKLPVALPAEARAAGGALENSLGKDLARLTRELLREIRVLETAPGLAAEKPEGATSFGARLRLESMTPFEIDFSLGSAGPDAPFPLRDGGEMRLEGKVAFLTHAGWWNIEHRASFSGPPNLPFDLVVKSLADFSYEPPEAAGAPAPSARHEAELETLAETLASEALSLLTSKLLFPIVGI